MNKPIVGLDIDQEFFVACLLDGGHTRTRKFKNITSGFRDLITWLHKFGVVSKVFACMEATGRYGEKLAAFLHDDRHQVVVVNPSFISSHKVTLNRHNKTDPKDSEAIADFARCFQQRLRLWQPKSSKQQALLDVVGQMQLLKKTITSFTNRSVCGLETSSVLDSIRQTVQCLEAQLESMERLRDELYDELPELQDVREIIDSVPGIGEVSADLLAAKIDFSNFRNGRDLAAFLGLGSRTWQSGKQKRRGKATKAGDSRIRATLRMGAMAALYRENSFYLAFADSLRKRGLLEKQIITAVARKMILIAHACVRKKQLFDCCYEHLSYKAA